MHTPRVINTIILTVVAAVILLLPGILIAENSPKLCSPELFWKLVCWFFTCIRVNLMLAVFTSVIYFVSGLAYATLKRSGFLYYQKILKN